MAAGSPVTSLLARGLVSRLAQGGAQPQGGMPGAQPSPPDNAGQQISAQLSELQGADPQSTLRMLQQMKSQIVVMYARTAFPMPEVSRNLAQMQKYVDNAIKAAEQGAGAMNAIANNAGQPQQQRPEDNQGLPELSQPGMQMGA